MPGTALARNPLFEGLKPEELDELVWLMRPRRFARDDVICRAGEPGNTLFLIVDGLARVMLEEGDGSRVVARLRRGDVIGEMSLVTGEPRTATVVAAEPTGALELGQKDFTSLIARHPRILGNLNTILTRKLTETTALVGDRRSRGEAICLLVGVVGARAVPELVAATEAASVRPVASLDARLSIESAVGALDDLLAENGTVILVADLEGESLSTLIESADRAIALVANEGELTQLSASLAGTPESGQQIELVVLADPDGEAEERVRRQAAPTMPVVRAVRAQLPLPLEEVSWLGRHLARTKLGLALGAGGAKGYAHIGALAVLEEAGFAVDYIAGSSIGAIIGAWHGLGMDVAEIEATMRYAFRPDVVAELFKLSVSGTSTGLDAMTEVLRETTRGQSFDDLTHPLVVMTVDLNARRPRPLTDGPLWEALLAATAVAGLFPPYEHDSGRLVDGLALVPVPTDAVIQAGADVTLSVNLMSRQTLEAWPGEAPPPEEPKKPRARMLDTILEVMDLSQLDSSERHAARADVVVTPRFGPASWRDFELADLFLDAGRLAAEEQLPALRSLAKPQLSRSPTI